MGIMAGQVGMCRGRGTVSLDHPHVKRHVQVATVVWELHTSQKYDGFVFWVGMM